MIASVSIRPADANDARLVYEWRNLPDIVALSENRKKVTWDEHLPWFTYALHNDQKILLIVQVDGEDAGLIRFDRNDDTACVGIYFVGEFKYKGYGKMILPLAIQHMRSLWNVSHLEAHIRTENEVSLHFFSRLGFTQTERRDSIEIYRTTL